MTDIISGGETSNQQMGSRSHSALTENVAKVDSGGEHCNEEWCLPSMKKKKRD